MSAVGFLGKIPTQPDFVRQSFVDPIASEFDAWLVKSAQNLVLAKAELPQAHVRFVFSAPKQSSVIVGVLHKSQDQVGRSFPLAIYTALPASDLASKLTAIPLLCTEFFAGAEAVLDAAPGLGVEGLRERVAALRAPDLGALPEANARALSVLRASGARELFARTFDAAISGAPYYALYTFRTAIDAARGLTTASGTTVLDCPIAVDIDLLAWLDLARRALGPHDIVPSIAWVEDPNPRLLLALGFASEQLLHFVADQAHGSARLWPLRTDRQEAISRAQDELRSLHPLLQAPDTSIDALWTVLSGGAR